ncbi:hypothetical protein D3C72_2022180 [compost metagenome]
MPKAKASSENTPPVTRTVQFARFDWMGPEVARARLMASPLVGAPTPMRTR